ncbi:hypothetical protein C2S51_014364 [Perilla frutescens var. frutescens]|nr:hypothetical protein C2S51_014364 [Perilla frutescens var. frutescens]
MSEFEDINNNFGSYNKLIVGTTTLDFSFRTRDYRLAYPKTWASDLKSAKAKNKIKIATLRVETPLFVFDLSVTNFKIRSSD